MHVKPFKKITFLLFFTLMTGLLALPQYSHANDGAISLPAPDKKGGKPLMQALAERKTVRGLSDAPISDADLSNLLWAAWGVNRADGKHTIPTAKNKQNVSLYVATKGALFIYNAEGHGLHKIAEVDLSNIMKGSVMLIMATEGGDAKSDAYGNMHVGSMYQNVGLYCASAGLGNVVHVSGADKVQEAIAQFLPSKYTVNVLQSVGKVK